jgi:glycosyltransferase involved in cell wall biosynthesis
MNLLIFNLAMDADHSVLGHTTAWTNALARRCAHVSVITMFAGRLAVEPNVTVHSLGKERGWSEPRRLMRFYALVRSVLRERRIDACFAHMAPLFTILFAPVAKRARIPILLWYAHSSVTPTLRLAHAAADRCVTSTREGFRLRSDKLFTVGQGVDVERFRPPERKDASYDRSVVSVGRLSPVKRIDEMLRAVAVLRAEHGLDVHLHLFGAPLPFITKDQRYESRLRQLAVELELNGLVTFEGTLPFDQVPAAYHRGGLFLNLSETGSLDKAILEGMASGCIPISRNSSFDAIAHDNALGWLVPEEGPAGVAASIAEVIARPGADRAEIADRLRGIVAEEHSLDRLTGVILEHLDQLAQSNGAPPTPAPSRSPHR